MSEGGNGETPGGGSLAQLSKENRKLVRRIEKLKTENQKLENEVTILREENKIASGIREQATQYEIILSELKELEDSKLILEEQLQYVEFDLESLKQEMAIVKEGCTDAQEVNRQLLQYRENMEFAYELELSNARDGNRELSQHIIILEFIQDTIESSLSDALSQLTIMKLETNQCEVHRDQIDTLNACLISLQESAECRPSRPRAASSQSNSEKCVICHDRERTVEIQPCGHIVMCDICAALQYETNGTCPMDRGIIDSMRNIDEPVE
uniref:Spindle pole body component 110-like n=1 Tax=Saccoglossus kowalevskii TaxID=10224 RepID=A0ABM0MF42_SACKO|nr:PREDICTED: spindle pole body component 110-like [Saccoglossus kowalevskii]